MAAFRRFVIASIVGMSSVGVLASPTAWAAPQGSCTTGSYVESIVGSDSLGTFTAPSGASSTGCTWTVPSGVTSVRVLVVGGGGGGGNFHTSGGGGGGGLIHEVGFSVTPGAALLVTVGKGGNGGLTSGSLADNSGFQGDNSIFDSLTAIGGGGGGGGGSNSQIGVPGKGGGSGGGGGRCWINCNTSRTVSNANFHAGGAGTAGQGNPGGKTHWSSGGGGGGAGAPGQEGQINNAGAGGDGLQVDITGTDTYYAGGGGGGTELTTVRSSGGAGGGGAGGASDPGSDPGRVSGVDGTNGLGGGGGGLKWGTTPGKGGSGIVIVRWGAAPVAPAISLSRTSGYSLINTSASGLYTITNTGGAVTQYSITPTLPTGLSFDATTGLISGTPTVTSAATDYTITATRVNSANGASSRDVATFNYGVFNVAPTTTTTSTTTTSTTSTTLVSTTTTVAPSTTSTSPLATTAPVVSTTTVVFAPQTVIPAASPTVSATPSGTRVQTPTLTTVAGLSTPTTTTPTPVTTTTVPAPEAPAAAPGEVGATLNGEEIETTLSRSNNSLVVSAADVTATIYATTPDGQKISLNADGNLAISQGDLVVVSAEGYEAGSEVEVWLRSTPVRLGLAAADASGTISGTFTVPTAIEKGNHRVILSGVTSSGAESVIGVGLRIGSYEKESNISRWVILFTIVLAITLALVIPTSTRRRRRAMTNG